MSAMKMVFGELCEIAKQYVDEFGPCQSVDDEWAGVAYSEDVIDWSDFLEYDEFKELLDEVARTMAPESPLTGYGIGDVDDGSGGVYCDRVTR